MNRRESILEKAEALFAEHGFEGTSIRRLAKAAEVNVAMVSYYFGSKEKLFEALVEYRSAYLLDLLKNLNEQVDDPVQRLEELIKAYVTRFLSFPRFLRILYREVSLNQRSSMHQSIADLLMRNVNEFRKIITDGMDKGIFRKVDVELTIITFIGTITHLITSSPQMNQRMLGHEIGEEATAIQQLNDRLVSHLTDLLHSYLLKSNKIE